MFESIRGQFLIADKRLRDPNFYKSVVLMVEHTSEGAMGLVVNRPSSVTVAHALSEHFDLPETDDLVHVGGPVEPGALFILHDAPELDDGASCVISGLYVCSSAQSFETVVRSMADDEGGLDFRIFSGCAGWGDGQLESELARGDWHLLPATSDDIFGTDSYELWDALMQRVYEAHRILPHAGNPEWN